MRRRGADLTCCLVWCRFVVIPVYAELPKICTAVQQEKDAPGIKPDAIQVILDALEENKGIHQLRANAVEED